MVKCVIIGKYGEPKTGEYSNLDSLYKKCKFRKKNDFEKRYSWGLLMNKKPVYVHIYAKNTGRASSINKYELPPPIDKDLFYGPLAVVASSDKEVQKLLDFSKERWEKVYEKLMGGFEDLDKEEEISAEEYIPSELKAQHGYSKENNFIVDDDDDIEYTGSSEDSEPEYEYSENDGSSTASSFNREESEENKVDKNTNEKEDEGGDEEVNNELLEADSSPNDDTDSELSEEDYIVEN